MLTRRNIFELGGQAAASLALYSFGRTGLAADAIEPRYFLHVFIKGGADATYLFDARSTAFTDAGKIANFRADKTVHLWEDNQGGKTWVSSLAQVLAPFRDRMSILNGVHMARGFDGHPQNTAVAVTGSPTGGNLFVADFPRSADLPLSFLSQGYLEGAETASLEKGVALSSQVARKLAERFRTAQPFDRESPALRFIAERASALGEAGSGAFAAGSRQFAAALAGAGGIIDRQKAIDLCGEDSDLPCDPAHRIVGDDESAMSDGLKVVSEYFIRKMAKSAVLSVSYEVDTHDNAQARAQDGVYTKVVDDLKNIMSFLDQTYDALTGRTFGDVTTVLVTSEFSRTMRQEEKALEATGTDHNPLTNTVLLLGCGVRKGLILGATDLDALDERGQFSGVSGAHLAMDQSLLKPMGKPFDISTLSVKPTSPLTYEDGDYLSMLNIINTLYRSFDAPDTAMKRFSRSGPVAAVLEGLLQQ